METRKSFFKNPLLIASLGCLMAFAVACGDDDDSSNPTPSGGSKATGGTGNNMAGEAPVTTAGKSTTTGGTSNQNVGGGSAGDATNSAGAGGAAPANCTDDADMGCYNCAPKTLTQFLNHCPTTGCEPFDNTKLTSIKAGKLPALPQ